MTTKKAGRVEKGMEAEKNLKKRVSNVEGST